MNRIYKLIWSKVKNCYVVTSELAKSHTKGCSGKRIGRVVTAGLVTAAVMLPMGSAWANNAAGGTDFGQWHNTAVGNSAVTGDNNGNAGSNSTAVGHYVYTGTGSWNVAVGRETLIYGGGSNNTVIGAQSSAGSTRTTSYGFPVGVSNNGIVVGSGSYVEGNSNIAIGNNAQVNVIDWANDAYQDETGQWISRYPTKLFTSNSIAIGSNTVAEAMDTTTVGRASHALMRNATAYGNNAHANSVNSIAIGNKSIAGLRAHVFENGRLIEVDPESEYDHGKAENEPIGIADDSAVAVGNRATAINRYATAIGVSSYADGMHSTAVGDSNRATGKYSTALGAGYSIYTIDETDAINSENPRTYERIGANQAAGDFSTAAGYNNKTVSFRTSAFGIENDIAGEGSLGIGSINKVGTIKYKRGTPLADVTDSDVTGYAVGSENTIMGEAEKSFAGAFGHMNEVSGNNGYAVGNENITTSHDSIAVGSGNKIGELKKEEESIVRTLIEGKDGSYEEKTLEKKLYVADKQANGSMAFGKDNTIHGKQSIAVGTKNTVEEAATEAQAIGNENTVSGEEAIAIGNENTVSGKEAIAMGKKNTVTGEQSIAVGYNHTINGNKSGAFGDPDTVDADGSYVVGNDSTVEDGSDESFVMGNKSTASAMRSMIFGNESKVSAEGGIVAGSKSEVSAKNSVAIGNNAKATMENSVALGSGSETTHMGGLNGKKEIEIPGTNTKYTNVKGESPVGTVSVGTPGKERTITNVAAGRIGPDSTDAVNGSELYAVEQQVVANTADIVNLNNRIDKVGAGAAALAGLHPLDFDPDEKWDFAASVGSYKSEQAVAIGAFYRPNEDTMFSIAGTIGDGRNMVNVGVSWKFGQKNRISANRISSAKEIIELRKNQENVHSFLADAVAGNQLDLSKIQLFPDVEENHWAYDYVATMAGNGVLEGYPDGYFKGNRNMTRYEMAAVLYRLMQNGARLSDKALTEFAPELDRIRVDTITHHKDGTPHIQRVRTIKERVEEKPDPAYKEEKLAQEKAAKEKIAKEKAEAQAAKEQLAKEKAEEKAAKEKLAQEKKAEEKAAKEQAAKEKAEAKAAKEKLAQEKKAQEKAAKEQAAKEKAAAKAAKAKAAEKPAE